MFIYILSFYLHNFIPAALDPFNRLYISIESIALIFAPKIQTWMYLIDQNNVSWKKFPMRPNV